MRGGKKLTVAQCKILEENGIKNPREWLYLKTEVSYPDGGNASKLREKEIWLHVKNKKTEDVLQFKI